MAKVRSPWGICVKRCISSTLTLWSGQLQKEKRGHIHRPAILGGGWGWAGGENRDKAHGQRVLARTFRSMRQITTKGVEGKNLFTVTGFRKYWGFFYSDSGFFCFFFAKILVLSTKT
jgi:hypothetical protein